VAKAPAVTFRRVAEEHIAAQERGWRNHKHGLQWSATLEAYAYPVLADLDPAAITTEHVLRVLSAIWATKPETASRVRGRVEAVLDAAKARGLRQGDNPARWKGGLALLLPPKGKVARVRHHPAVAIAEAPALVAALAKAPGQAARLCRFAMATACRSAEARAATWAEFDLGARLWSLPAGRTKNGKPHRVPLSDAALAVLAEVMPADAPPAPGALVFPGARGRPLSDMAATQLLRGLRRPDGTGWTDAAGATITLHGSARSTFADWALEVGGFPPHLVELALAHALGDATARAYMRGDGLDARRPLMAAWGAYLTGQQPEAVEAQGAEVIPLPVRRAG
jgi:integrase